MPDDTTILSLPMILPAQAQKHVTHNEALAQLDLIVQLAVINRVLTTAPALPTLGDRHIVAAGATGPWVGQSGRIALYGETGWQFTQPLSGWQAHVLAEGQTAVFDGLVWETLSDGPLTVTQLGVSATADATNRLSVSSPAVLLNHAGAGHQVKVNKAAAGDTASLLFQTGFSGRAEMGTAGTDGFDIKVSADGAGWSTALAAQAATGEVTLPKPLHLGGQAADPGAPANGTLWLNTTTGEVKVRSAGVTAALGGGVSDGDKGDVTVSGGGTAWAIDADAVTNAKLADMATARIKGRTTAGTGDPEDLTAAQARGILNVADGATANASDAGLRDRATHTGSQLAATISDFSTAVAATAAVTANTAKVTNATHTGDVTGATALTIAASAVTLAKMADVTTASVFYRKTALAGAPEVQPLATLKTDLGLTGTNTGDQTITLTGDLTGTGTGTVPTTIAANAVTLAKMAQVATSTFLGRVTAATGNVESLSVAQAKTVLAYTPADIGAATSAQANATHTGDVTGAAALTIAADAVTNAKLADMATARIKGRTTAGTGDPEDLTAAQTTALLDGFTSGAKGLVPASGGGTANFLRADGAFAVPAGTPGGATGEVQFNNAGALAGAADVEIETGQLRLPSIAVPTAPAAGGLKLFGRDMAGRPMPAFRGPSGLEIALQPHLSRGRFAIARPVGNNTAMQVLGLLVAATGTATTAGVTTANRHARMARLEYLVTTAATTAVVGFRSNNLQWTLGASTAGDGGFHMAYTWAPATGVATLTSRAFAGMQGSVAAPTDVEPSSLTNLCGMGWDAADANIQFMHNDGVGGATKINLGASFPVPLVDRTSAYRIELYAPPGLTQVLSYEITDLVTGAVAIGTVTTDLPAVAQLLATSCYMSVGGTSSVVGIAVMGLTIESDY